jgi:hypothetical protein
MAPRQQVGIGIVVAGVVLALVGVAGLAGAFGGRPGSGAPGAPTPSIVAATAASTAAAGPTATTRPTAATASSASAGPSQPPNVLGLVAAFLAELADAYHAGTVSALAPRLHPAVLARYGEAACQASLGSIQADPTYAVRVRSVGPLATWDWASDGRTTPITDTATVAVDLVRSGATSAAELHFAFVDGQLRWFSDCGTPLP